jgi:hypothetical protein
VPSAFTSLSTEAGTEGRRSETYRHWIVSILHDDHLSALALLTGDASAGVKNTTSLTNSLAALLQQEVSQCQNSFILVS